MHIEKELKVLCEKPKKKQGRKKFTCAEDIFELFKNDLAHFHREIFIALGCDSKNGIIDGAIVSLGGVNQTLVDMRVLFRELLLMPGISSVIVIHNHPSGNCCPSEDDNFLTEKIKIACRTLDLNFIDHIVFGEDCFFSYREHRKI